jgi:Inactivated superfamily I helicase
MAEEESESAAPLEDAGTEAPLRLELHRLEQYLRGSSQRYVDLLSALEEMYQTMEAKDLPPASALALLERLFAVCLTGFEDKHSPSELGLSLEALCGLLLDCGKHLWERFLIDAECLFRIMQSLIPELSRSIMAQDRFAPRTLLGILRRLMEEERVPFEASPLVGLQIMGMLETRLLSFRRVIILEACEDSLPGSPAGDPCCRKRFAPNWDSPDWPDGNRFRPIIFSASWQARKTSCCSGRRARPVEYRRGNKRKAALWKNSSGKKRRIRDAY